MKKIIEFLKENGIEYRTVSLGNPYYYNDGFTVQGITVRFDYELAKDMQELHKKEDTFLKSMKRKKKHCIGYSGRCGIYIPWYTVLATSDFEKLKEHEARIDADVEKFWKEEHERRECQKSAAM
jgi:hypothetical protein